MNFITVKLSRYKKVHAVKTSFTVGELQLMDKSIFFKPKICQIGQLFQNVITNYHNVLIKQSHIQ